MKPVLNIEEVTRLEDIIEREGTSKAELMEHAGELLASVVEAEHPSRVLVLTGFGNNGGDGWVAADILQQKDIHVDVVSSMPFWGRAFTARPVLLLAFGFQP